MLKSSILWAQANKVGPFRDEATVRFGGRGGGGIQKTSCMAATSGDLMSVEGAAISTVPFQPQGLPNKMLAYPGHAGILHGMTSAQGRKIHHGYTAGWCHRYYVLVICARHPQEAFGAMSGREAAL